MSIKERLLSPFSKVLSLILDVYSSYKELQPKFTRIELKWIPSATNRNPLFLMKKLTLQETKKSPAVRTFRFHPQSLAGLVMSLQCRCTRFLH